MSDEEAGEEEVDEEGSEEEAGVKESEEETGVEESEADELAADVDVDWATIWRLATPLLFPQLDSRVELSSVAKIL